MHKAIVTGVFKTMQPPTSKIHGVKVAIDFRQSNTIPAFRVFYSEKLLSYKLRVLEAIGVRLNVSK